MITGKIIKELREKKGLSQTALAGKIGVSLHSIFRLEKGTRAPKMDELQRIAAVLGVPVNYFISTISTENAKKSPTASSEGEKNDGEIFALPEPNASETRGGVLIPVYNDIIQASAGNGNEYTEDCYVESRTPIDSVFIADKKLFALYGKNLHAIKCDGDSMEPVIHNGDYIVYFETNDNWTAGNILVVKLNGKTYVKGAAFRGDRLVLKSANPRYKDIAIDDWMELLIIGRVLRIVPPSRAPEPVY